MTLDASSQVGITGCGKCVPKRRVSNPTLARRYGVTPDWIEKRTGIRSRYYAGPTESASSLAASAAQEALESSKIKADEISLIVCCSYSSEYLFPPIACKVQQVLNAKRAGAFDVSAGSAGVLIAMALAGDHLSAHPDLKSALVIGVAVQSPFLSEQDRKTGVVFGDGAAAVVLSRVPAGYGLLGAEIFSLSDAFDAFQLRRDSPLMKMDGITVGKEFIKHQPPVIRRALNKAGLGMGDADFFLFHQANLRLIELLMEKMGVPLEKTYTNVERYGNTSDASLALALCEAAEKGLIKRGDRIVLSGVGAGLVFAASVLRWY